MNNIKPLKVRLMTQLYDTDETIEVQLSSEKLDHAFGLIFLGKQTPKKVYVDIREYRLKDCTFWNLADCQGEFVFDEEEHNNLRIFTVTSPLEKEERKEDDEWWKRCKTSFHTRNEAVRFMIEKILKVGGIEACEEY